MQHSQTVWPGGKYLDEDRIVAKYDARSNINEWLESDNIESSDEYNQINIANHDEAMKSFIDDTNAPATLSSASWNHGRSQGSIGSKDIENWGGESEEMNPI